jgi:hypothetical protein
MSHRHLAAMAALRGVLAKASAVALLLLALQCSHVNADDIFEFCKDTKLAYSECGQGSD